MRMETDGQTDGRYQVHYLPRFAVDKNVVRAKSHGEYGTIVTFRSFNP